MKLYYNRTTRRFSIKPVLIDSELRKSYLDMLKESDEQCALISKSKIFAKSSNNKLIISRNIELQYFIYSEIAKESNWINAYLPRYDKEVRDEAIRMAKSNLAIINQELDKLRGKLIPSEFKELKEYRVGSHKSYKFKIDNFNRLVIKPIPEYSQVRIIGLMFHYDDPIEHQESESFPYEIKQALFDMYNDLKKDSKINPTELRDRYDN